MNNRDKYQNKFNVVKNLETEQIYKTLRNAVSHSIRIATTNIFNERINTKRKDTKFHHVLKSLGVVESHSNKIDHCNIDPNLLNYNFFKKKNGEINDDIFTAEVNEILKKSLRPCVSFSEVSTR